MKLNLGRWRSMLGYGPFAAKRGGVPLISQFSGGRTSGLMTAMMADDCDHIAFENTGREHEKTLEFVNRVGDALGREVEWLEFRPPPQAGMAPRFFQFEKVTFKTAARKGEPFLEFMSCINAYRKMCGNPQISPWAGMRLCTVYLKHKVLDKFIRSRSISAHDRLIGIRADEGHRISELRRIETKNRKYPTPLHAAGIVKSDVIDFWARQAFDLDLPEHLGNCDGCFLKDQADVARAIGPNDEASAWWSEMQKTYLDFGGRNFAPYEVLAAELPTRLKIEAALRAGRLPNYDGVTTEKRFKLLVIQERRRIDNGPGAFSCACESSMSFGDDDDD